MDEQQMLQFFASKEDVKQAVGDLRDEMGEKFKDQTSEILTVLDQQTAILRRLEEELTFGTERVNRIEKNVEKHEQEISKLKVQVATV